MTLHALSLRLAALSVAGVAAPLSAQFASGIGQTTPVAPAPPTEADRLADAVRRVGRNPRDLAALIEAADLSFRVGDVTAAAALYKRAEQIDPTNGRVKAGIARILVNGEHPGEALRLFDQAQRYGVPIAPYADDRGFAYDLIGEQERAQRDYRLALAQGGPDVDRDEVQRRYALSLGISGRRDEALAEIDSLLRRSDRGAWRARAFILAMSGDVAGANKIATSMMPVGMATGLAAFFQRLPTLSAVDRAFAVHFGEVAPTPARIADARLVPALPQLGPDPYAPPPVQVAAAAPAKPERRQSRRDRERAKQVAAAASAAVAGRPAPQPSTTATQRPVADGVQVAALAPMSGPIATVVSRPAAQPTPASSGPVAGTAIPGTTPSIRPAAPLVSGVATGAGVVPVIPATPATVAPVQTPARVATALPTPAPAIAASILPSVAQGAAMTLPVVPGVVRPPVASVAPATGQASGAAAVSAASTPGGPVAPVGVVSRTSPTRSIVLAEPPNAVAGGKDAAAVSPSVASTAIAAAPSAIPRPSPVAPTEVVAATPVPGVVPAVSTSPAPGVSAALGAPVAPVAPTAVAPAVGLTSVPANPASPAAPPRGSGDSVLARIIAGITIPAAELEAASASASTGEGATLDQAVRLAERNAAADEDRRTRLAARREAARLAAEERKTKELVDRRAKEFAGRHADAPSPVDSKKARNDRRRKGDVATKPDAKPAKKPDAKPDEDTKTVRGEPARIWVQVAGGATEGDLGKAWKAAQGKAPALAGRAGYTTPLRASNRVVTGPFKTEAEARAVVNRLAKQGVSAFTFTSVKGQKMTRLDDK